METSSTSLQSRILKILRSRFFSNPFVNPFRKHKPINFEDVYIPLGIAERHSTSPSSNSPTSTNTHKGIEPGGVAASDALTQWTLEDLRAEIDSDNLTTGRDTEYDRKSKVINKAIQDIGMGWYQYQLFALCGFGWLADNLWLQAIALILSSLSREFGPSTTQVRYTTCAGFVGLCVGAFCWGVASDIIGRRYAFNATLFLGSVFGIAVGAAPSWIATCGLIASLCVGIGGNLPVDGALFLEFLPIISSRFLTLLSIWWPFGQLISSILAWILIVPNICEEGLLSCHISAPGVDCCQSSQNKGWRYFIYAIGGLTFFMFACRFFLIRLYESPKFLLSRGRQSEAVAVIYELAYHNKKRTWLTEEILNEIGGNTTAKREQGLPIIQLIRRFFERFSADRIAPLFATRELGIMTCLVWICWATIGMGYPLFNAFLPQYLENAGRSIAPTPTNVVYRNYLITSVVGVPGSGLAYYLVENKYIGRKGTMASATLLTGIILFLFTISSQPTYQLFMSSLEAFFQNIMYGVLYAYTPEIFPAPNRGTGTGIASCLNRITGLCAPIVAAQAGGLNPNAPVYASGALILAAFLVMCFFPIETRGRQSL